MGPKLKELLIKKITLAQKDLADDPELKAKLEGKGRLTSLREDAQRPENALLLLVRKKLLKGRLWESVKTELAQIALTEFIRDFDRKQTAVSKVELSAARERQLVLFPGFESLPTRIRRGNNFLKFPETSVPQFLEYAAKYEERSQRDQKTADELRRMARAVEPYAKTDLTMEVAFERARVEAARKVVTMPNAG